MFLVLISAVVCDAFDIWMGVAFDALNSATRCWALCPIEEGGTGTIACRVTVQSPRWAFPPRLPGGPTAAGHFLRF